MATSERNEQQQEKPQKQLRQALAVAIVSQKRKCAAETAEWRAKSQKLEAELLEQQTKQAQLKQWVQSVVDTSSATPQEPTPSAHTSSPLPQPSASVFLPPLSLSAAAHGSQQPVPGNFQALQQQVISCQQYACSTLADVLDGRAAALSSMLLTNVQMLQQLSSPVSTTGPQRMQQHGSAAGTVAGISAFITSTLLHCPNSALSTAYMKQCAVVLAAVLAPSHQPTAAQDKQQQPESDSPEALAVLVLELLQQLLQQRAAAADGPSSGNPARCSMLMLQQLSTLPSTALLLCLAAAQRLQQHVVRVQEASADIMRVSLETFSSSSSAAAGEQAMVAASNECLAAHELLVDMVSYMRVFAWVVPVPAPDSSP